MTYAGVRRCNLCSSELLGRGGLDICLVCRLIDEDPDMITAEDRTLSTDLAMVPIAHARVSMATQDA